MDQISSYADEETYMLTTQQAKVEKDYTVVVSECVEEDFSDLEELQFWEEEGADNKGNLLVRVIGKYLPATVIDSNRLKRFLFRQMHEIVASERDFSLLYIHTGTSAIENSPGMFWLWRFYECLPFVCKHRLKNVFVLHPALGIRFSLWALGGWFSEGLYKKVTFISRVEFLWDYMGKDDVEIPEFVMEHDKELEERPLMDYGIVADPLRPDLKMGPPM